MAEILLLPVSENKQPTYLNSTSGLQSGHIGRFGMIHSIISPSLLDRYQPRPNISTKHKSNTATAAILDLLYSADVQLVRRHIYGQKSAENFVNQLSSFRDVSIC